MRRVREIEMKNFKFGHVLMALIFIAAVVAIVFGLLKHDVILIGFGVCSVLCIICDALVLKITPNVEA